MCEKMEKYFERICFEYKNFQEIIAKESSQVISTGEEEHINWEWELERKLMLVCEGDGDATFEQDLDDKGRRSGQN